MEDEATAVPAPFSSELEAVMSRAAASVENSRVDNVAVPSPVCSDGPSAVKADDIRQPIMEVSASAAADSRVMDRLNAVEKTVNDVKEMAGQILQLVHGKSHQSPLANEHRTEADLLFRSGRSVASI